jgi:hypothetical protein
VNSGHGTHLYWRLEAPLLLDEAGNRQKATRILEAVRRAVGGDHTNDVARLLRLPEFDNVKDARNGAPPAPCVLVSADATRRHGIEAFPEAGDGPGPAAGAVPAGDPPPPDVLRVLAGLDAPGGDRSRADFRACCDLIRAGVDRERARGWLSGKSKFGDPRDDYFDRTWSAAAAEVAKDGAAREEGEAGSRSIVPGSIEVLGLDDRGDTLIWSRDTKRLWRVGKLRELDHATLIQMAGPAAVDLEVDAAIYRNAIAAESRKRVFGADDVLGAGVWRLDGDATFILNVGNRAYRIGPDPAAPGLASSPIEIPLVNGKLLELTGPAPFIDVGRLVEASKACTADHLQLLWCQLLDTLAPWKFSHGHDRELLAALAVATPLQQTWDVRPHAWLTGATNTGKTALVTLLNRLWPFARRFENETSEAAVRQQIGATSVPCLIDECENWHGRRGLIKLARSATRRGAAPISKGTPSGRPLRFYVHHMFWMAAVSVGLRDAVDRNRFVVFELTGREAAPMPPADDLAGLGLELLAAALVSAAEVRRRVAVLSVDPEFQRYGRLLELLALPATVRGVMCGLSEADARAWLGQVLSERQTVLEQQGEPDEQELLQAILSATVRYGENGGGGDVPVGDLLRERRGAAELNAVGIKLVGDKVFFNPKAVEHKLLRGTAWSGANTGYVLARVPGAERHRLRAAGVNAWGLLIPVRSLGHEDVKP